MRPDLWATYSHVYMIIISICIFDIFVSTRSDSVCTTIRFDMLQTLSLGS